jgi:hypothetical protein
MRLDFFTQWMIPLSAAGLFLVMAWILDVVDRRARKRPH